ncbi:MAG: hypothetical protein A2W00_04010 [Candidatus Eisenbacteria bacterium RBG_16_71_46]|nr:MAG: hypothetical protein A2W00_04010 [Candidatus Eisenbacteria bacterium RBG_16_71_46]
MIDRIAALERRARRLEALVAILAVGYLVLLAWRLLPRPEMSAQKFSVRDRGGMIRAELSLGDGGTPSLRLNDAAGKARAMLLLRADGSTTLRFTDARGENRAQLLLRPDGSPLLRLSGPGDDALTEVQTVEGGAPALLLRAPDRTVRWTAP